MYVAVAVPLRLAHLLDPEKVIVVRSSSMLGTCGYSYHENDCESRIAHERKSGRPDLLFLVAETNRVWHRVGHDGIDRTVWKTV